MRYILWAYPIALFNVWTFNYLNNVLVICIGVFCFLDEFVYEN